MHRLVATLIALLIAAPSLAQTFEVKAGDKVVTITVTVSDPPPVAGPWSFTATPAAIESGESSTLSFLIGTADVRDVFINGEAPAYSCNAEQCSGALRVTPADDTTYILTSKTKAGTEYPRMTVAISVVDPPPPPPPTSSVLLEKRNLVHVGCFGLPTGDQPGWSRFGYPPIPGGGMTFSKASGTLFLAGHTYHGKVAEVTIPAVTDCNPAALKRATLVQPFADPTEGGYKAIGTLDGNSYMVGGLLAFDDQLCLNGYQFYDGPGSQPASLFCGSRDLKVTGDVVGPLKVGTLKTGYTSQYLAWIPPAWREALGGPAIAGGCCMSIIGRTSYGPAAFSFDPATATTSPVTANPLVYYPDTNPLAAWDATSPLFNGGTKMGGAAFPEGTDSLLFFGRHAAGTFCYGVGCYPGAGQSINAPPYVSQVWAYDAKELAKAKRGEIKPWAVKPYAVWTFEFPINPGNVYVQGVAYDPAKQLLYISQEGGERPTIHVYKVSLP